jgi:hypothetical protein
MAQVPAHLLNRPSRNITSAAASNLGGGSRPPRISRAGNTFTMIDPEGNARPVGLIDKKYGVYVDVLIVGSNPHPSRQYYEGGWDPDNPGPPICFSDNGTGPSTQSQRPQHPVCSGCPQAAWGSAQSRKTGKDIPACTSNKKLAVMVVGDDSNQTYEFVIPPGSWNDPQNGWKRYVNTVASVKLGTRNCELSDVVTRAYFVQGKMGTMGFDYVDMIDPEQAKLIDEAWEDETAIEQLIGMNDVAINPAVPLTTIPAAVQAPVAQSVAPPPRPQPQAQLTPPQEEKRGRGRPPTRKDAAAQPQTVTAPFAQPAPVAQSAPEQVNSTAGMQMPKTPDEALKAALAQAFTGNG